MGNPVEVAIGVIGEVRALELLTNRFYAASVIDQAVRSQCKNILKRWDF